MTARNEFKSERAETSIPPREINHLAFGGGGWRTMYATGVISTLRKRGILKDVQKVAATSGGCIPGFALAFGYNSEQSMQFLEENALNDKYLSVLYFIPEHVDGEPSPYYRIAEQDHYLKQLGKYAANAGIFSFLFMKNVVDVVRSRGIFHTRGLEELLWRLMQQSPAFPAALRKKDLTFLEHHQFKDEFKENFPDRPFVDLHIAVTENTPEGCELKYYSYELTPNESILKAACASMTIPVIFRHVEHAKRLRDGGILKNIPRDAFDSPRFFKPKDRLTKMNMRTLAVCFSESDTDIAKWRHNQPGPVSWQTWLTMRLFGSVEHWELQEKEHQVGANALRTLYLNSSGIFPLAPKGLTTAKYKSICDYAEEETEQFVDNYLRTVDPHISLDEIQQLPGCENLQGYFDVEEEKATQSRRFSP